MTVDVTEVWLRNIVTENRGKPDTRLENRHISKRNILNVPTTAFSCVITSPKLYQAIKMMRSSSKILQQDRLVYSILSQHYRRYAPSKSFAEGSFRPVRCPVTNWMPTADQIPRVSPYAKAYKIRIIRGTVDSSRKASAPCFKWRRVVTSLWQWCLETVSRRCSTAYFQRYTLGVM